MATARKEKTMPRKTDLETEEDTVLNEGATETADVPDNALQDMTDETDSGVSDAMMESGDEERDSDAEDAADVDEGYDVQFVNDNVRRGPGAETWPEQRSGNAGRR